MGKRENGLQYRRVHKGISIGDNLSWCFTISLACMVCMIAALLGSYMEILHPIFVGCCLSSSIFIGGYLSFCLFKAIRRALEGRLKFSLKWFGGIGVFFFYFQLSLWHWTKESVTFDSFTWLFTRVAPSDTLHALIFRVILCLAAFIIVMYARRRIVILSTQPSGTNIPLRPTE